MLHRTYEQKQEMEAFRRWSGLALWMISLDQLFSSWGQLIKMYIWRSFIVVHTEFDLFLEALAADTQTTYEFEQDNAHPHMSKRTHKFFEALARKHGLTIMDWPANLPDLSPIKDLWAHLKYELRRQFPDTAKLKGWPQTIRAVLWERLHKI